MSKHHWLIFPTTQKTLQDHTFFWEQTYHGQVPPSGSLENQWRSSFLTISHVLDAVYIWGGYPWAHSHADGRHTHLHICASTLANQCCRKWSAFSTSDTITSPIFIYSNFCFSHRTLHRDIWVRGAWMPFLLCDKQHLEWLCGSVCTEFAFYWNQHQSFLRGLSDWFMENGWNEGKNSWSRGNPLWHCGHAGLRHWEGGVHAGLGERRKGSFLLLQLK